MKANPLLALFYCCCSLSLPLIPVRGEAQLSGSVAELTKLIESLPGTVSIDGFAERKIQADRALVHLLLKSTARELQAAMDQNLAMRNNLQKALREGGIEGERIKISRFASQPNYSSFTGKVKEHTVTHNLTVQALSEADIRFIAGLVDKHDELTLSNLTFEHSEKDQIVDELLQQALARVLAQKEIYQTSLGVTLTPRSVHHFSSGNPSGRPAGFTSEAILPAGSVSMHRDANALVPDQSLEELVFQTRLRVTFDLKARD
ncbi:MAG: SIMPL domain-containing protein [Puniceicoccaceae bacterium]